MQNKDLEKRISNLEIKINFILGVLIGLTGINGVEFVKGF
jgi:hypothetical protein